MFSASDTRNLRQMRLIGARGGKAKFRRWKARRRGAHSLWVNMDHGLVMLDPKAAAPDCPYVLWVFDPRV